MGSTRGTGKRPLPAPKNPKAKQQQVDKTKDALAKVLKDKDPAAVKQLLQQMMIEHG